MGTLLEGLDTYLFTGITGNFAWEVVKRAWEKLTQKSREQLYLEAFDRAVKEERPYLLRYASDGDVLIERAQLDVVLHQDLGVSVEHSALSRLTNDEFTSLLTEKLAQHEVLLIGGHSLPKEGYAQLVRTMVRHSTMLFKEAVVRDEAAFRRAVLDEALSNHELLASVQQYLKDNFSLVLGSLDSVLELIRGLRRRGCWVVDNAFMSSVQEEVEAGMPSMYERLGAVAMRHIVAGQDVRRNPTGSLVAAIKALRGGSSGMRFHLVRAKGGNGKTTFLLRLAYELWEEGEYVLLSREGESPDEETLRQLCSEVAEVSDAKGRPRRVSLLLNDAYRNHTPLLQNLHQLGISNLNIVAASRYGEIASNAPTPGRPLLSRPRDLSNLSLLEATELIKKVGTCGALRAADANGSVNLNISDQEPLLVTVARLTGTNLSDYVVERLREMNEGRDPIGAEPSEWTAFLRLYYAIAQCYAWGVPVPQTLLPALAGLTSRQVVGLLCEPGTGVVRRQAQEHLQGECGSLWGTDHELIATVAHRQLSDPAENEADGFLKLFSTLADLTTNPQVKADAAALAARLFRRVADTPTLIFQSAGGVSTPAELAPIEDAFILTHKPPRPEHERLSLLLDEHNLANSLASLRTTASSFDLGRFYLPAYSRLCRWREVHEVAEAALADKALPANAKASVWLLRGVIDAHTDQHVKAVRDFDRAIALRPQYPDALFNRGLVKASLDLHEDAINDYTTGLQLRPYDPMALTNRGFSLSKLRRNAEALADYNLSLQLDPDNAAALSNRGLVYKDLGKYEDAFEDFDRAEQIDTKSHDVLSNRGLTYYTRGLERLSNERTKEAQEDFRRSLRDLDRSLELKPDNPETLTSRGNTLSAMGEHHRALQDFDRSLQLRPNHPLTLNNRGHTYILLGQYKEALADCNKSLKLRPDNHHTLYNRATIYFDVKKYDKALADLDRVIELLENLPDTREHEQFKAVTAGERGDIHYRLGHFEKAASNYTIGLAAWADNATLLGNRAVAYLRLARTVEAEEDIARMLELKPDAPGTLYNMACYQSLQGKFDEAVDYLKSAIEGDPTFREKAQTDIDFTPMKQYLPFRQIIDPEMG